MNHHKIMGFFFPLGFQLITYMHGIGLRVTVFTFVALLTSRAETLPQNEAGRHVLPSQPTAHPNPHCPQALQGLLAVSHFYIPFYTELVCLGKM